MSPRAYLVEIYRLFQKKVILDLLQSMSVIIVESLGFLIG